MSEQTPSDSLGLDNPITNAPNAEAHAVDPLLLNLQGFEGPIHILLQLARDQKVDLINISILELVRQYLGFIDRARELSLDLAAEYLVMAAWLAYLKSRLLLPEDPDADDDEPSAEEMAASLAFQLQRLEAMKRIADDLFDLPTLGKDFFARGMPEGLDVDTETTYRVSLFDLVRSYGDIARRQEFSTYEPKEFEVMSMEDAMERLQKMLGKLPMKGRHSVWTTLQSFLPDKNSPKGKSVLYRRSSLASMLTAGLEMVKQGKMEIRQDGLFKPIYMRVNERDDNS